MFHDFSSICSKGLASKNKHRLIFLGDSITQSGTLTHGYITLTSQRIAKHYPNLDIELIGAGINGHKVNNCLKRLDRDVLKKNPSIVLIYIGINDVWHWQHNRGSPKDKFEKCLRNIIEAIQKLGAKVILCTPSVIGEKVDATNKYDHMLDEYADITRKVSSASGSQLLDLRIEFKAYIKAHNPQNIEKGILTHDGVHLNKNGHEFLSNLIFKALKI
ncbi:MAG: SGNH/GDSL hydrolase family protein [Mariprofundaceae bacterium]